MKVAHFLPPNYQREHYLLCSDVHPQNQGHKATCILCFLLFLVRTTYESLPAMEDVHTRSYILTKFIIATTSVC